MKIESKTVSVPADRERVFEYITNLNNFQHLLPQDRISEWESTETYCSFKVQGTATIDMQLKDSKRPDSVLLESGERSPFPFTLEVFLNEDNGNTKAHQIMQAKVNPFLKMMVEKPLANLFDYIADKLTEKVSN
jgi:carbon monoxide dehydrogenase subunit G